MWETARRPVLKLNGVLWLLEDIARGQCPSLCRVIRECQGTTRMVFLCGPVLVVRRDE